ARTDQVDGNGDGSEQPEPGLEKQHAAPAPLPFRNRNRERRGPSSRPRHQARRGAADLVSATLCLGVFVFEIQLIMPETSCAGDSGTQTDSPPRHQGTKHKEAQRISRLCVLVSWW